MFIYSYIVDSWIIEETLSCNALLPTRLYYIKHKNINLEWFNNVKELSIHAVRIYIRIKFDACDGWNK